MRITLLWLATFAIVGMSDHAVSAPSISVWTAISVLTGATQPPADHVHLSDGTKLTGMIRATGSSAIDCFQIAHPRQAEPYLVVHRLEPQRIRSVDRMAEHRRAELMAEWKTLLEFPSRIRVAANPTDRIEFATLRQGEQTWLQYQGVWFRLESGSDGETTRRCIARIEQIFTAFSLAFPAKAAPRRELLIRIHGSMDRYWAELERRGFDIANPACYSIRENFIVAGSELAHFGNRLRQARLRVREMREQYQQMDQKFQERLLELGDQLRQRGWSEAEISRELTVTNRSWRDELKRARRGLDEIDLRNQGKFDDLTRQMFKRLYHELFHAYLENFLFHHRDYQVPAWLNEGLAEVFQGSQVESEILRVDQPDRQLLRKLKQELAGPRPLDLIAVLQSSHDEFLHGRQGHQASDRLYLYCWGLTYYLFCMKNQLTVDTLTQYVTSSESEDLDPIQRFETLVGMDLVTFQQQWRREMLALEPRR